MSYAWAKNISRGLRYRDFGHGVGSILWWWDGRLQQRISDGTFNAFHNVQMACDPDTLWRGRYERGRGILTIQPEQKSFLDGSLPPEGLLDMLVVAFHPKRIYADTKRGFLRRIVPLPDAP